MASNNSAYCAIMNIRSPRARAYSCRVNSMITQTKSGSAHRILLVDDDEAVRTMMNLSLTSKGFEVVAAAAVTEALRFIVTESFDVLITDLHMPHPSDGFTVVSAMRHSQPEALALLISGYPDVQGAMSAILTEADEIITKPFETAKLVDLLHDRMRNRKPAGRRLKERVAVILGRCMSEIIEGWLDKVKKSKEVNDLGLSDQERTAYLPRLIDDLIMRLQRPHCLGEETSSICSKAAVAHGKIRKVQGYTPHMLVHDSRMLQVTLFGTIQKNVSVLDFSLLLPDVMIIADEVDSQLTQAMASYAETSGEATAA
jgi:DNA-binding response OmpR family regulator